MLIFEWNFKMSNNNSSIKMSTYTNSLGQVHNKIFNKTSHGHVKIFKKHHILALPHSNTRGGSRTAATSKMERLLIIVNGWTAGSR